MREFYNDCRNDARIIYFFNSFIFRLFLLIIFRKTVRKFNKNVTVTLNFIITYGKIKNICKFVFCRIRKKCNEKQTIDNLLADVDKQLLQLDDVEQTLPKKNGLYLRIILGTINVSILNKNDRWISFTRKFKCNNIYCAYLV